MRYLLGIFILVTISALVLACRDDIIVEPPPPLDGSYTGTYEYVFETETGSDTILQHILMRFTDETFTMDLDKSFHPADDDRIFCDVEGIYALAQGVELRATKSQDSNYTAQTCQVDKGPFGPWSLDQSTPGVVVMKSATVKNELQIDRTMRLEIVE